MVLWPKPTAARTARRLRSLMSGAILAEIRESRREGVIAGMTLDRDLLTTGQAAKLLQVSHDTVKRLYEQGLLEGFKTSPSGHIRLYRTAIEEYDRQRKSRPHSSK